MLERRVVLLLLIVASTGTFARDRQPESLTIQSGDATLHAMLWRPDGRGPFPAVLIDHGSGRTREQLARLGPYEQQADTVCRVNWTTRPPHWWHCARDQMSTRPGYRWWGIRSEAR